MLTVSQRIFEKINGLSYAQIDGFLAVLLQNPGITSNKLIQITGLPKETLKELKIASSFMLENSNLDSININKEYLVQLQTENPKNYNWKLLNSNEIQLNDELLVKYIKDLREKFDTTANREFDQFYATPETSVAKALILNKKGLLNCDSNQKLNIAVLGDDDLVSLVLAKIEKKANVSVFELDEQLKTNISNELADLDTKNVQITSYDVRNDLKSEYTAKFDCVITDPPYTKTGVLLFLNRAIELLSPRKPGYIFLYYGNSIKSPEKTLKIEQIINQAGLLIEDKINNFAQYNGAESIGSNSSLYILKSTPFTKTVDVSVDLSKLYTHQTKKEDRFPYVDHVVLKLYNVSSKFLSSKTSLQKALGQFCSIHRLNVVDQKVTKFKKGGLTLTYVLANSNLVIHTWPEMGALHIDLVTCSPIYNKPKIRQNAEKLFESNQVEVFQVE